MDSSETVLDPNGNFADQTSGILKREHHKSKPLDKYNSFFTILVTNEEGSVGGGGGGGGESGDGGSGGDCGGVKVARYNKLKSLEILGW